MTWVTRRIPRIFRLGALVALSAWLVAGCDGNPALTGDMPARGSTLEAGLVTGKPTLIEFGGVSCASCRDMKVVLDQLRAKHGHRFEIVEIDLIRERERGERYGVLVLPTQVFFDSRGQESARHVGALDIDALLARLMRTEGAT